VLMADTDATIAKLKELKDLGVRLALDDFGTGYSSLSYLSRFPIDILKVDKAFVDQLGKSDQETTLAAAIVKLGESLHLKTVAEGIEVPDQIQRLLEFGCGLGQGFHFARPMDTPTLLAFLQRRGLALVTEAAGV
jgi:EAL domain-containing protein (putative c-di-GMP-specific phosphodiesterase class I)